MGLFLNFGAGLNLLSEPWKNLDATHDIRKRLKFENDSAAAILAEHVIEHVPFLQVLGFFQECRRVLEPGGVLRIAFPDLGRFLTSCSLEFALNKAALRYADGLSKRPGMDFPATALERTRAALWHMLTGWGHQTAWTEHSAAGALLVVGFSHVCRREYGHGELERVDGHHRDVGPELALLESTILEARK
jgi:predicted SAM-dependent methyltransferase